jgi:hypothetical protein
MRYARLGPRREARPAPPDLPWRPGACNSRGSPWDLGMRQEGHRALPGVLPGGVIYWGQGVERRDEGAEGRGWIDQGAGTKCSLPPVNSYDAAAGDVERTAIVFLLLFFLCLFGLYFGSV